MGSGVPSTYVDVEDIPGLARDLAKRLASPEGREALRRAEEQTRLRTEQAEKLAARRVDLFKMVVPLRP